LILKLVCVLMLALILKLVCVLMLALMMMLVLANVLILGPSSRPTDGREPKHSECTWDLSSERGRCLGTS
jgi:hypothetical protein